MPLPKPRHLFAQAARAVLLAVLATSAASCGKPPPSTDPAPALRVGFAQVGSESDWRRANTESVRSEAAARGIDLVFVDAQGKQENQIRAIRGFIAQKVDVIAFPPVVETGWDPVLKEARDAGIPVILTDRAVATDDPTLYATFIGADFVEEGRRAAAWLAGATGGQAVIVELQGTAGSAPAIDRKAGFEEGLAAHPGMQVVRSQSGEFTRSKGKEVMEAFLKSSDGGRITAVYAHNDDMALGAIQAIREAGRVPGRDILVVSVDGVKAAFEAMVDGSLNCTVECTPLLGPALFDAAADLAAGRPVPRRIVTDARVFDQSSAAAALPDRRY